jgi:hypothetical protein
MRLRDEVVHDPFVIAPMEVAAAAVVVAVAVENDMPLH